MKRMDPVRKIIAAQIRLTGVGCSCRDRGRRAFFRNAVLYAAAVVCWTTLSWRQGHAETVQRLPQGARIVVIGGALTEIVYALGAQDQLVARDSTSTYPPAARMLKDIGYMRALSAEGVLSLAPGGILLVEGSGPPETLDVLAKASVPMVVIPEGYDRHSVIDKIRRAGHALHREKQAEALIRNIDREFAEVEEITAGTARKKRVLFVLSVRNERIVAAGSNTAADGIITLAGGGNAMSGYSGYRLVNDEAIAEAAPDVILSMADGGRHTAVGSLADHPAVRLTPAAKTGAIHQVDGLLFLGFGPRTARAARELAEILYPDMKNRAGLSP